MVPSTKLHIPMLFPNSKDIIFNVSSLLIQNTDRFSDIIASHSEYYKITRRSLLIFKISFKKLSVFLSY